MNGVTSRDNKDNTRVRRMRFLPGGHMSIECANRALPIPTENPRGMFKRERRFTIACVCRLAIGEAFAAFGRRVVNLNY